MTSAESRCFHLQRGVKQGDPLSALLFIVVMEDLFRPLQQRWKRLNDKRVGQYYGVVVDDPRDPLTNLRFADDVILLATNKSDIVKMINDLTKESCKYGLKLHAGKTVALTNAPGVWADLQTAGFPIKVAKPHHSERYLGRQLCIGSYHATELSRRVALAWACFMKFKGVLCNRHVPFHLRADFFDAVITETVLYGCAAWTLTSTNEHKLRTTRRMMLRWMWGAKRQLDEEWVDFIRRSTRESEAGANKCGVRQWVSLCYERKWEFAGKTARGMLGKWSTRLLNWKPWFRMTASRLVGRPLTRWEDCFVKIAGGDWTQQAQDEVTWKALAYHHSSELR